MSERGKRNRDLVSDADQKPLAQAHVPGTNFDSGGNIQDILTRNHQPKPESLCPSSQHGRAEEEPEVVLTTDQEYALKLAKEGRNIFITGNAGTGKSVVTTAIIQHLRQKQKKEVGVTAPTGIAAVHIDGRTLHSWSGWIPYDPGYVLARKERLESSPEGVHDFKAVRTRIAKSELHSERYVAADVLVIDEISMLHPRMFADVEHFFRIAPRDKREECEMKRAKNGDISPCNIVPRHRYCRNRPLPETLPWSGIQLILVGDFMQLPPIKCRFEDAQLKGELELLFNTKTWRESNIAECLLTETMRQRGPSEQDFVETLRRARLGKDKMNDEDFERLAPTTYPVLPEQDEQGFPLSLTQHAGGDESRGGDSTMNRVVPTANQVMKCVRLRSTKAQADAINNYHFSGLPSDAERRWEWATWRDTNSNTGKFTETAENCLKDLEKSANCVKDLRLRKGTRVILTVNHNINLGLVNGCCGTVVDFIEPQDAEEREAMSFVPWVPVVEFEPIGNFGRRTLAVAPKTWFIGRKQSGVETRLEDQATSVIASITQIPLKWAWSMTIHKAQGLSLDKVEISFARTFSDGQAYVGISRVREYCNLIIAPFSNPRDAFMSNAKCIGYYERLESEHARRTGRRPASTTNTTAAPTDQRARAGVLTRINKGAAPAASTAGGSTAPAPCAPTLAVGTNGDQGATLPLFSTVAFVHQAQKNPPSLRAEWFSARLDPAGKNSRAENQVERLIRQHADGNAAKRSELRSRVAGLLGAISTCPDVSSGCSVVWEYWNRGGEDRDMLDCVLRSVPDTRSAVFRRPQS